MSTEQPSTPLTYWDYVNTDKLLSLQAPLTDAHDELQFIIVHQTFELWFKLAIYELREALNALHANDLGRAVNLLKRVASILRTSLNGFDPLMTMSQQGYAEFRDALHPASGFQSSQFRIIEILMGIERVASKEEREQERFYWENAVQAGVTFTHFMNKYHEELVRSYEEAKEKNLRGMMLRATEEGTGRTGVEAYRYLLAHRDDYPVLMNLAEAGRDLQQAMLDFRLHHHKVTVFTVGEHAAGTSDAHAPGHPSCAAYLLGVIRDRSTIFPELEEALTGRP
jgi:tryptophan 2,3-dioxygenase